MGVFPFRSSLSLLGFSFHFLHQVFHLYELPLFCLPFFFFGVVIVVAACCLVDLGLFFVCLFPGHAAQHAGS